MFFVFDQFSSRSKLRLYILKTLQLKKMSNSKAAPAPTTEQPEGGDEVIEPIDSVIKKKAEDKVVHHRIHESSTKEKVHRENGIAQHGKAENTFSGKKRKERKRFSREEISKSRYKPFYGIKI